jgi:ABC-type multidrug transport system fused ATPase/permease subunit
METERIDNLASTLLSGILPAALTSLCLAGVLLYLNPLLVLLLSGVMPLMWLGSRLAGRKVKREVRAFQEDFEGFSHGVQFVLRQMDLTRIRGHEDAELSRQTQGLRKLESSGVRMAMSFAISQQIQNNLTSIGGLLLLIGGGIAVMDHVMSLGGLMAFYLAAGTLNGTTSRMTGIASDLITGDESLRKLRDLSGEEHASGYHGKGAIAFKGDIALRGVDFAYDQKPVLRNVSLNLAPGSRTALIGPNGAGKSTVINLILGFYKPSHGGLSADGVAYDDLDLRALRRQIGVVMQRPTFFTGTVAENLTYGWPDVTREAMVRAAELACADTFINTLSDGYDTLIGEGGLLISGGEAQRLAIARALIGRPKLLILDEPTNHLDAVAVTEIMHRVTADPAHAAVLTISHDMTVVRFADAVFQLKSGTLTALNDQPMLAETD